MAPNVVCCTMVPFQHILFLAGCILSPVLFLVVIVDIFQASIAKHHSVSKYSGIRCKMDSFLQHLDYADDICLLLHSVLDAANMFYSLENEAVSFGLKINSGKTKSMTIVNSSTTRQPRPNAIVLNGHPVEVVNQFTNFGSEICKNGGSDADVESGRLREPL